MKAIRIGEVPTQTRSGGLFTGTIESKPLVNDTIGAKDLKLTMITFPKGVKNKSHSHTYDQALYIVSGKGIVATDKEEFNAEPGMVFFIPRGEKHWHGATEECSFSHISILRPGKVEY